MASKKDVMLPVLWQNMFPQSDLKEHFFFAVSFTLLMKISLAATPDIYIEAENVVVVWLSHSIASLLVVPGH